MRLRKPLLVCQANSSPPPQVFCVLTSGTGKLSTSQVQQAHRTSLGRLAVPTEYSTQTLVRPGTGIMDHSVICL